MDSQGESQVKVVDDAVLKPESQGDSPAADVTEDKTAFHEDLLSNIAQMVVAASDWNNRMRDARILKVSSKIPEVGTAASIILSIFWPVNKVNIFESIKQDIANLVDKMILAKELEEGQNEIVVLNKVMKDYQE